MIRGIIPPASALAFWTLPSLTIITPGKFLPTPPLPGSPTGELHWILLPSLSDLRTACDEGNIAEACHRLSAFYIQGVPSVCEKDMQEAFKYSLKACELGNMGGCVNVSMMYSKGEGTDKNPVAAKVGSDEV